MVGYSEHDNGTGIQFKTSAAYNSGNITSTRDSSLDGTEAGTGKTSLNSYAISSVLAYGLMLANSSVLMPFAGVSHTNSTRGSYAEDSSVTYPISYNSFSLDLISASGGFKFKSILNNKINFNIGAGFDYDVYAGLNSFSGTSSISGLSSFSLSTGDHHPVRMNVQGGVEYKIAPNQNLTANVDTRTLSYSSTPAVSLFVGYRMAL